MIWWLILVLTIAILVFLAFRQTNKHKAIVGKKVLVNYFDQNTAFETIFPLTGTVTGIIKVGRQNFFVVQFDKPFVYHNKGFDKIAITERHAGYYIGGSGEIHVHVCLPKKDFKLDHYELTDFDHVVWATIQKV